VHRELRALIPGQRPPQRLWDTLQRARDRVTDTFGGRDPVWERQQDQEPRSALYERSDPRPVSRAHDQIPLPMTRLHTVLDLSRSLVDHPHRSQPPTALQAEQTPTAALTACWPCDRDRSVIDRLVNRLLAQPPPRLAGEQHAQLVRDLLRAPTLAQQPLDRLCQHAIGGNPPLPWLASPQPGDVLGMMRAVTPVGVAIAADLATDRRRSASQISSDPADCHPRCEQVGDPDPFQL
jgi:hypothetical protein